MKTNGVQQLVNLREEVRRVRESILSYVVRMDDILLQQIPQIRADYALKIGCWEQALLEAELAERRARRRLQLAQAQANQGVEANMDAIEGQLDAELAEWMAKVEQARLTYEQTLAYLTAMTGTVPVTLQFHGNPRKDLLRCSSPLLRFSPFYSVIRR
ncbi:MAG: hypothetical protein IKG11_07870 [Atopobiaceae bacterium]|nr:hypothetical protein [Atopobiaceae bacterium]